MKHLLLAIALLFVTPALAQAVNTRTFTVDPPVATENVAGWRVYCGTQATASSLTSLVKDTAASSLTFTVGLPDSVKYCAAKWYKGVLEGPFSNIVDVVPPASAPVLKITTIETFSWAPDGRLTLLDRVVTAAAQ